MAAIRRFRFDPRSGPLVAALGSIAAGTLIAAISLGQSIGPLPIDNPAIAILPGSNGAPVVLNVGPATPELDAASAVILTPATDLGLTDAAFPPRDQASSPVVSTSEEAERTEPAPPQDDAVRRVQRVVGKVVATLTAPLTEHRGDNSNEAKQRKRSRGSAVTTARQVVASVTVDAGAGVIDVAPVGKTAPPAVEAPVTQPVDNAASLADSLPTVSEPKKPGS